MNCNSILPRFPDSSFPTFGLFAAGTALVKVSCHNRRETVTLKGLDSFGACCIPTGAVSPLATLISIDRHHCTIVGSPTEQIFYFLHDRAGLNKHLQTREGRKERDHLIYDPDR